MEVRAIKISERTVFVGIALTTLVCLAAIPAFGDLPVHNTFSGVFWDGPMYGPGGQVFCNGNPIHEYSLFEIRETIYFEDGVATRYKAHISGSSVFTSVSGKEATGTWVWNQFSVEPWDGVAKYVGNVIKAQIPGVGVILQDAGLQIYDHNTGTWTKIVGTYQWNLQDFDEFCAAME
jgi:hypothetical protein